MIFYDTETCGFHGPITLIQYAKDDEEPILYSPWENTVGNTMDLIRRLMDETLVGFNLEFDHFHLCQMYTTLEVLGQNYRDRVLADIVDKYYEAEPDGRDGSCLRPAQVCDLMIAAKKGKYQATMDRRNITIRRVPVALAETIADHLEKTVKVDDIYFSKYKDPNRRRWHVEESNAKEFKDIVLRFAPSASLKNIAKDAFPEETSILKHDEIQPPFTANEVGWAPYAKANLYDFGVLTPDGNINPKASTLDIKYYRKAAPDEGWYRRVHGLPIVLHHHRHWRTDTIARQYGRQDVILTRKLYHLLEPEINDTDSVLTCLVAASRWRGYGVNLSRIRELKEEAEKQLTYIDPNNTQLDPQTIPISASAAKRYLQHIMSPLEKLIITSTKKILLEKLAVSDLPCAARAKQVLTARKAVHKIVMYHKLLQAGRFHAALKVLGTLSSRMSGDAGFNAQGIPHDPVTREAFTFNVADMAPKQQAAGYVASKGDFWQYEVVITSAVAKDPTLQEDLLRPEKIHGIFGTLFYYPKTYEEILANKELYTRSKSGVFALFYGGEAFTLMNRLGLELPEAEKAVGRFMAKYKGYKDYRDGLYAQFSSLEQSGGVGTKVSIREAKDYAQSLLGFKRMFTLENRIIRALFALAQSPPREWKDFKGKVTRRDREQTELGAAQSALYGGAFAIQSGIKRAALNHVIQSTGAGITKKFQEAIWLAHQSQGVNPWVVQILNIHDELIVVNSIPDKVKQTVDAQVDKYKSIVPLLRIDWNKECKSWA